MASQTSSAYETRALETLLAGLVDYAGLFPPAAEKMRKALENYAGYLEGGDARALGRFIVPVSRLEEMERYASDLLPRDGGEAWHLSALLGHDIRADIEQVAAFNG